MASKHDKLIDKLARETRDDVDFKWKNTEYGFTDHVIGEIDLLMYSRESKTLWMFEVKTSPNPVRRDKAIQQMNRARSTFVPLMEERGYAIDNVLTFYVHGHYGRRNMQYTMRYVK